MRRFAPALVAVTLMASAPVPPAPAADRPLPEVSQEARAQALHHQLRCVVCQNQSIAESDAVLAADLRNVVRERIAAGDTDAEVLDYVVQRYGDFVLMRPPVRQSTWLLWAGPFLVLLLGGAAIAAYLMRRRAGIEAQPLTEDERRRLDALLDEEEGR
ncbi:cytochrome c-type biogenesis protein [Brevundimonas sp.]|uniref:cytochrome c-type biogenesis protein n=1 Tax=Brevundimonas sp. TaxID=1871086 RepID=UPI0025DCB73C|nr:cytochrome c-type biogenesis protein [Brevundimonas sp.]